MKKIELLAPAGSYDIFLLALKAGADAVYFSGPQYGARAFAKNFTNEEVVKAIHRAHYFDKKAYITVNTLLKEVELHNLYNYLKPFYEEGLDGIIVQDFGVLDYVSHTFPDLEIHASTQMAVMGSNGIDFLEARNVKRVVLARELTVEEIHQIKEETNLQLEIFVHGAMCYAYSGQCLLSSIIGGRSGNRGRCAQPCRLPYQLEGKAKSFPISMKDQCGIAHLDDLIRIGVDSLKIEGRMKKAEYVYKVISIYRKYIDLIYKNIEKGIDKPIRISNSDLTILESLYVRNEVHDGYFDKKSGQDMITLTTSAYKETADKLLAEIREEYEHISDDKIKLRCNISVFVEKPIQLVLLYMGKKYCFEGKLAEIAKNQPISKENIKKQILKTQDTVFQFVEIEIETDEHSFVPVAALNALRRSAIQFIENEILNPYRRKTEKKKNDFLYVQKIDGLNEKNKQAMESRISVMVSTMDQFKIACSYSPERIYISLELFSTQKEEIFESLKKCKNTDLFLSLPHVFRQKDLTFHKEWCRYINHSLVKGVLVRNIEEVAILEKSKYKKVKQLDYLMYCMNSSAVHFWDTNAYEWTGPIELNKGELNSIPNPNEMLVYGRIPVMLSANCITNTMDLCEKKNEFVLIKDRMNKVFPIKQECKYCYNIMYNSTPLSLHKYMDKLPNNTRKRLEFTIEDSKECKKIFDIFLNTYSNSNASYSLTDYTTGHYKRGVD